MLHPFYLHDKRSARGHAGAARFARHEMAPGRAQRAAWGRGAGSVASLAVLLICAACETEAPVQAPVKQAVAPPPPLVEQPTRGLASPRARPEAFRRGVSLGLFVSSEEDAVRRPIYTRFLDEIAAHGATDLQLVVRWAQADVKSNHVVPSPDVTVDDGLLSWVMGEARARKLRVFLMPTLHVKERAMGRWRGTLEPGDWDQWWWSYRRFIGHYARLAQRHRVALLAVGSELLSTERQREQWASLIKHVRKLYKGDLTYSANWDHFEPVSFWSELDVVGVTAYQQLSKQPSQDEAQLAAGFRPFVQRLRAWARQQGKRYIFTEVGYPAQAHAAVRPWDYRSKGEADQAFQLACYRALYEVWQGDPALDGIFLWNWFGEGGTGDPGYTPRGRAAAEVLRHWYAGSRPEPSTAPSTTP